MLHQTRRLRRIAAVTAVTELSSRVRIGGTVFQTVITLALTVALWNALYAGTSEVAGITREQAVTYAVVAALATYLRVANRAWVADAPAQHIRAGTVVYWFIWLLSPARYHLVRAVGDVAFALVWVAAGYLVCLLAGAIAGPPDTATAVLAVLSLVLGQAVAYLIGLLLDLVCFWTLLNEQVVRVVVFVQALLSGGFAPLYFFPGWFQQLSRALPFQAIINSPLSIYLGRVTGEQVVWTLAGQLGWCAGLSALAWHLWRRIPDRLEVQGG